MTKPWGTERLELGKVKQWTRQDFSGDFSSAISLVVTLSTTESHPPDGVALGWWLTDSLDQGKNWSTLEDTAGDYSGSVGWVGGLNYKRTAQTRRFVVPFGPRLSVGLGPRWSHNLNDAASGSFSGVVVTLFWRGIG
jgi:hypothetical protein